MGLPYHRRSRRKIAWWQLALMSIGVIFIVVAWQRLNDNTPLGPVTSRTLVPGMTPTVPNRLMRGDVLPTPTPDMNESPKAIIFPAAALTSPIIKAVRTSDSWETRYLGDSVGHLDGTAWFDSPGGNIVLAGHVENEVGAPGPFAYLFKVEKDDVIVLRDGSRSVYYRVSEIVKAAPDDIKFVAQDGRARLTLITCSDYDWKQQAYLSRLIVIAEPVVVRPKNTATPQPGSASS